MIKHSDRILKYELSLETIDKVSDEIISVCSTYSMERKSVHRHRLAAEECLTTWLETLGEGREVRFETGKTLTKPFFKISVEGQRCNPYETASEEYGHSGGSILLSVGLIPAYTYVDGKNVLTFQVRKKPMHQLLLLSIVIASAVLIGVLGKIIMPADTVAFLCEGIITPIEDTFFNILSCIAGPMIFLSVAWGVYGIGDVYTIGKVGKKLMVSFLIVVFLFSAAGTLFYPLLGPDLSAASSQTSQFGKIFTMLLDIIPSNIVSPFVDGNTLQIIMLAFVIGLSMIFLGQRTSSVARAIEQINYIISFLMGFISKLIPYFVFIVLVQIIWSDAYMIFSGVWRFAVVFLVAYVIFLMVLSIVISVKNKVNFFMMIKAALPSYMIALTTASSSATFESNMHICQRKFGVSNALSSFGIPLGMVLFKPTTAMYYFLFCCYFASAYSVQVSVSWIIIAVVITAISAVATPPIPGGAAATYTILFIQLGIPAEALAIALAVDIVFDFFLTSGDMYSLIIEMLGVSKRIGMSDDEIVDANLRTHKHAKA